MKITKLYYDSSKCPECRRRGVMYEKEEEDTIERYCNKCNYSFKFKKEPMYY